MQDRIAALEEMNAQFIPSKAVHEVASEMILLEAEREIARLKAEVNKLKGGK